MQNVPAGLFAGFIATVVLSAMVFIKGMMSVMPELDVAEMIGMMPMAGAGLFGMNPGIMTLLLHVVFGAVLASVYSMFLRRGTLNAG